MRLVDEWHKCWKWASVQLAALTGIAAQLYLQFPQFQEHIPPKIFTWGMSIMAGLIILGRVIQKEEKDVPPQ